MSATTVATESLDTIERHTTLTTASLRSQRLWLARARMMQRAIDSGTLATAILTETPDRDSTALVHERRAAM